MIVPASIRNNNPGAMYPGKSSAKFGSTTFETLKSHDGVHKIARFQTPIQGAAAQFDLLYRDYTGKTVEKAITRWCGSFYAASYLELLNAATGIKPTDALTQAMVRDPAVAIPLCRAMAQQEAGKPFPLDDAGWAAAHALAFPGASKPPAFEPSNDMPSPKPETRSAELKKKVATVAAVATTAAGTAGPVLPSPPDLGAVQAWQTALSSAGGVFQWIRGEWVLVVAGVSAYLLICHVIPIAKEKGLFGLRK